MLPPAPALFSTMNCWPSSSAILAPMRRATVSVGPPAEKETTIRTVYDGYWSWAFAPPHTSRAAPAARCRNLRRGSFGMLPPEKYWRAGTKHPANRYHLDTECEPADGTSYCRSKMGL